MFELPAMPLCTAPGIPHAYNSKACILSNMPYPILKTLRWHRIIISPLPKRWTESGLISRALLPN